MERGGSEGFARWRSFEEANRCSFTFSYAYSETVRYHDKNVAGTTVTRLLELSFTPR